MLDEINQSLFDGFPNESKRRHVHGENVCRLGKWRINFEITYLHFRWVGNLGVVRE